MRGGGGGGGGGGVCAPAAAPNLFLEVDESTRKGRMRITGCLCMFVSICLSVSIYLPACVCLIPDRLAPSDPFIANNSSRKPLVSAVDWDGFLRVSLVRQVTNLRTGGHCLLLLCQLRSSHSKSSTLLRIGAEGGTPAPAPIQTQTFLTYIRRYDTNSVVSSMPCVRRVAGSNPTLGTVGKSFTHSCL